MFRADCRAALSSAEQALDQVSIGAGAEPPWVYRLEAHHIGTRSQCHLELHDPQQAADYAKQTLGSLDPSAVRNKVFITVFLGMAQVQRKEIEEAARLLGDAGEVAAGNSSARLTERLQQAPSSCSLAAHYRRPRTRRPHCLLWHRISLEAVLGKLQLRRSI